MKKFFVFMFFFFITFLNVGAKEEYLKSILIDGESIAGFATDKTLYEINVKGDKETIKIAYDYDKTEETGYKGKGDSGEIKLKYGLNELEFTLTSQSNLSDTITYKINITREDLRSSDNTLSSLTVAGVSVNLTDKLEYDVSVDSSLTNAEVKAVLKSEKASFVSGYGERTGNNKVSLSGEKTKVEVKVQAENESIRTYVINIIKKDYKSNDATLKSLTIDDIKLNFKPTTYEYNLNIPYEVDKINIKATANHEKATIEGVGEINLKEGLNNLVVLITAEDESKKEYKLNITREEEVPLVSDIKIEGIEFEFDPKKYDYEIETTLDNLEFNITLNSETATSEVIDNESLKNGSIIKVNVKDGEKTVTYNFKIVNEEVEIPIDENEEKKEKNENKNTFLEKYEMHIGLSVFGLGLLSLLIAILTRPKKSQIM